MALSSRISRSRSLMIRSRVSTILRSDSVRCCSSSLIVILGLQTHLLPARRSKSRSPALRTSYRGSDIPCALVRHRLWFSLLGLPSIFRSPRSWVGNSYLRAFRFAFRGFALADFKCDFVRLISWNRAAISETVNKPFRAKIVWVAQAFSD